MEGLAQLLASLQAGSVPLPGQGAKHNSSGNIKISGNSKSSGGTGSSGSSRPDDPEAFIKSFLQHLDELAQTDPHSYDAFVREQGEANGIKMPKGLFARAAGAEPPLPSLVVTAAIRAAPGALPAPGAPRQARVCIWKAAAGAMAPATVGNGQRVGSDTANWGSFDMAVREKCAPTPAKHPSGAPIMVYEVEANDGAIAAAARNKPPALRALVVERALRVVEAKHGMRLERAGLSVVVAKAEADDEERAAAESRQRAAAVEHAAQGTAAQQLPASLLQELAGAGGSLPCSTANSSHKPVKPAAAVSQIQPNKGQAGAGRTEAASVCGTFGLNGPAAGAQDAKRRPLIEELPDKGPNLPPQQQQTQQQDQQEECSSSQELYQVTHTTHRGVPCLRVVVPGLPISSASEADLHAVDSRTLRLTLQLPAGGCSSHNTTSSSSNQHLRAGGQLVGDRLDQDSAKHGSGAVAGPWACGEQDLQLPEAVDMDRVKARFDSKQQQLVLTLSLLPSSC